MKPCSSSSRNCPRFSRSPCRAPAPNGRPFTLDDLQRLAAANSPVLRQAASDVEAAGET